MKIKFPYWDNDNHKSTINFMNFPNPLPSPLKPLDDKTLQAEPGYANIGFTMITSNWFAIDPNGKKVNLLHERAYFPHNWTKEATVEYWLCDTDFKTPYQSAKAITDKGCDASKWNAQQHFYSEEVGYFIQTNDFDEALKFLGYEYVGDKTLLPTAIPV